MSETSSQSSRLSQGAAPDVSHPHRNPAKRLRWGEEGQGSGVRDGHKAVPNGADFDPTRCRVPFSAKYTLRVKGRPCWGRQPHTEPQRGVSEANRRLRRLLGRRCCRGQSPHTPSESPRHFAARRDESVIVGYYTSAGSAPRPAGRTNVKGALWQETTGLTVPVQETQT